MSNTSDLLNGDVLLRSTDATSPATQAVSFGDTTPGTTTGTINVRGTTERERMVQQIKTIADRLTSSLRGSADPGLTPQHELDLSRAIETETATAKQDADETSVCLGQVSHDIRTRMTSILGYADLLLDTWLTDDQTMKVRGLKQATTSLLVVINELLDLSALEAGQLQVVSVPVNLHTIVAGVRSGATQQADAGGLYLQCEIGPDVPEWVNSDATRLGQVLRNLVTYGLKSTPHGGVRISVTKGPSSLPDGIRFEVTNTGTGIPTDQQATLFRTAGPTRYSFDRPSDGTGLSLAISKRLIEAMGGSISVAHPVDGGSVSWFDLPLVEAIPPAVTSPVVTTTTRTRKGHILVAEDLPMNQVVIKEMLEADGHHVTIAGDGIAAINALRNDRFDLVLMDVAMPAMGGLETAQALRALDGSRTIPILALTAHALPAQIAACRAAGMNDYLSKPIDRTLLLDTVGRWLDRCPATPTRVLNVLVADDVLMNRDIADSFLRAAGHKVTCVSGGAEAIAAVAGADFDVVLMDVRMPEMDGLAATRKIRGFEGIRGSVPIVALTADAFVDQVADCYKAGMIDHVSKPFTQETLVAAVLRAAGDGPVNGHVPFGGLSTPTEPPSASKLPIRDPKAFESTAIFLAPDTVEAYLQSISERGQTLLHGLRSSSDFSQTGGELAEAAHALAGSAGMFGFARLDDLGRRFEWAIKRGTAEAPALAEELETTVAATIQAIHNDRQDWAAEALRRGPQPR